MTGSNLNLGSSRLGKKKEESDATDNGQLKSGDEPWGDYDLPNPNKRLVSIDEHIRRKEL